MSTSEPSEAKKNGLWLRIRPALGLRGPTGRYVSRDRWSESRPSKTMVHERLTERVHLNQWQEYRQPVMPHRPPSVSSKS